MNSLRLALISRRYWPLVGGAEMVMANLASELLKQGHHVQIITAQWQPDWPTDVVHREVPVVRLPNPPQRAWGTLRYMMALGRWLRTHRQEVDVVYVSMLKHDAYAAIDALRRSQIPVILRAEGAGATGDCQWQQIGRFGGRIRKQCQSADRIVAPSRMIHDELIAAGYAGERVVEIPNGVSIHALANIRQRHASRNALAESCLAVTDEVPVAVYTGRLHAAKGLHDLIRAWKIVVNHRPDATLWLVGDGPERDALFETVMDCDLRHHVVMPGAFDDVQDVLYAADIFVLPSHEEGMSISLLEAMASGLPVIASDIAGNRALITHGEHGVLVPPRDSGRWAAAILHAFDDRLASTTMCQAARRRVEHDFSLKTMAQRHLQLFEEAIRQKRTD